MLAYCRRGVVILALVREQDRDAGVCVHVAAADTRGLLTVRCLQVAAARHGVAEGGAASFREDRCLRNLRIARGLDEHGLGEVRALAALFCWHYWSASIEEEVVVGSTRRGVPANLVIEERGEVEVLRATRQHARGRPDQPIQPRQPVGGAREGWRRRRRRRVDHRLLRHDRRHWRRATGPRGL